MPAEPTPGRSRDRVVDGPPGFWTAGRRRVTEDIMGAPEEQALADVLGALSYGLLRTFQVTARAVPHAPTVDLAERQARFAQDELQRFEILRGRVGTLTDDPEAALRTFRSTMDAFYDAAATDEWL